MPKPKVWVVLPQTSALYEQVRELLEAAGAEQSDAWESVDWREVVEARPREVWAHDGVCACGRRTYFFAECARCLRAAASADASRSVDPALSKGEGVSGSSAGRDACGPPAAGAGVPSPPN
eukprot:10131293-Alexandrium_andersonii.AAC.1